MDTPERSTAAAFPRYLTGEVVADSVALHWPGLYARRWRLPRVVDRFLVPATSEPHISCNLAEAQTFAMLMAARAARHHDWWILVACHGYNHAPRFGGFRAEGAGHP